MKKEINKIEVLTKIEKLITNKNFKKDFKSLMNSDQVVIEEYAIQVAELNATIEAKNLEIEELKKRPAKKGKSQKTLNREFKNQLLDKYISLGNMNIDDMKMLVLKECKEKGDKEITLSSFEQVFTDGKLDPKGGKVRAKNNVFKKQVLIDKNGICSFKVVETK